MKWDPLAVEVIEPLAMKACSVPRELTIEPEATQFNTSGQSTPVKSSLPAPLGRTAASGELHEPLVYWLVASLPKNVPTTTHRAALGQEIDAGYDEKKLECGHGVGMVALPHTPPVSVSVIAAWSQRY